MRSTARTGKLKRSKARRASGAADDELRALPDDASDAPDEAPAEPPPRPQRASVAELIAALHGGVRRVETHEPDEDEDDEDDAPETEARTEPEPSNGEPSSTLGADGAERPRARWTHADPDDLGLVGYEDDESQDEPPPDEEPVLAPAEPRTDGVELSDTLPMAPEDDLSRVKGQASPRLMSVIESLLFASDRPLTVRDIRRVLKEPTVRQVQLALKQLQIDTTERGVVLSQVAGGFRLRTNPNNAQWVQRMLAGKPTRLSRSQLEALAVIAYRQPITKPEIDHVRGVDCGAVLRVLLERNLVRIVGRKEEPGRPHLYGTTIEFLEFFNLRSLRDMPDLHEFRELTDESRATVRAEFGEDVDELESEVLGQEVLSFGDREPGEASATPEGDATPAAEATSEGEGEASETLDAAEEREPPAEPAAPEASEEPAATDEASEDAADSEAPGASEEPEASEASEEDSAQAEEPGASEEPEASAALHTEPESPGSDPAPSPEDPEEAAS